MNNFILSLFALLVFVLSIPGTMALRNISAVLLLLSLLAIWYKNRQYISPTITEERVGKIVLTLMAITIYIFIHSIYLSHEPDWSLGEFKSHWLYPVLYFVIGILLALITQIKKYFSGETLITFLFYSIFLHVLYLDLSAFEDFMRHGLIVRRYGGLSVSVATASYLTNILLVMILSETLYRHLKKKRILKVSNTGLFIVSILCLLSIIIESSRFGIILSILISFTTGLLFFRKSKLRFALKFTYSIIFISVISTPLIYSMNTDPRWGVMEDTISIVLKGDNNKYWLDAEAKPLKVSGGENVSSGYLRLAWIVTGIEYIAKDMIGIGYGRNSFGHAIEINEDNSNFRGGALS